MWPFQQKPSSDVDERIERLERSMRDLSADWDATYDKFHTLLARWAKRDKAADAEGNGGGSRTRRDYVTRTLGG